MDCIVCLDTANSKTCSACPFCANVLCRSCIQTYLLQEGVTEPICPNIDCKKTWGPTFLTTTLTAAFRLGPYKTHREKVLFDIEKARLPDTQEDAKRYKDALPIYEAFRVEQARHKQAWKDSPDRLAYLDQFDEYRLVRKRASDRLYLSSKGGEYPSASEVTNLPEVEAAQNKLFALEKKWKATELRIEREDKLTNRQVREVQYSAVHYGFARPTAAAAGAAAGAGAVAADEPKKRTFIMKCPQSACEGFLSSQYKCGLCEIHVCAHCHVVKTAEHVCDPALVETIKQIRKEAKPCPKCASLISKIDGCDQMWCTQCFTAFSWTTGAVATGVVHNPHYFQYLRETGQAIPRADNPGFGCNQVNMLAGTLTRLAATVPKAITLVGVYRQMTHMRDVDLMARRRYLTEYNDQEWRRILRVKRLVGEIDDAKWKDTLQRREKSYHKDTAWVQLLEMYTTVSLETMAELTRLSTEEDFERVSARLDTIRTYTLQEAEKIAKIYGCVNPLLSVKLTD